MKTNNKFPIKSIFEQISSVIFTMTVLADIQSYVVDFVNKHDINDVDKKSIIKNINACRNVNATYRYICNSLLKYEGMSLNGHSDKKEKIVQIEGE